jgi:thiol-disulfide isomerase/thioredoxin
MPRPPVLTQVDWPAVHGSGVEWSQWLDQAESEDNRKAMETILAEQVLDPPQLSLLKGLPRPVHIVAIAEDWCGDVIRHAPVLQRLAQAAPMVKLRFISREQHPDVFIRFLTNGGEAIPKFVFLSDKFVECGNWGPMEEAGRKLISRGKACGDVGAARAKTGKLYEADADRRQVVRELTELIDIAASTAP